MNAPDTSVVVAAFASWHESHETARRAIRGKPRLFTHVAIETFAVLTRLPPPHRASPKVAVEFLSAHFPGQAEVLAADEHMELLRSAPTAGISGGAIYDALVAATAKSAGLTLLTLDRRALPTYERVGAKVRLLFKVDLR